MHAEKVAREVLGEAIDEVIFAEMPWLEETWRKHRTMNRLGYRARGAPELELEDEGP